ncbi:transglutaminaseTgpA domain-containing protein [Demetria terragena]|uniref:transglutaminase family protein n=1 Tax=Demetria terragena TaxID=63959 RepID=UPI00035E81EA|nr:DUF3488 and transglutaminase-like domain-containing protein [Demetria terragena]
MGSDGALSRVRLPEAILGALAVLVASWPLTNLLDSPQWFKPVGALLILVVGLGCLGRYLRWSTWVTGPVQALGALTGTYVIHLRDYLAPSEWYAMPGAANDLFLDAGETLTTYSAPAPVSPGVAFLLTLCLPLVGVLVDILTASLRMSAAAGLPLLGVFLFSTSNTGDALNPIYFLALAAIWLGMLLQQSLRRMRRWASTEAYARTPERGDDRLGLGAFSARARWMGVLVLALAVAAPLAIPHLPTQYFADGLAQREQADNASVGFTDNLDLSKDLNSRDQSPILTYATTDIAPPPLRVLTVSNYGDGNWTRRDQGGQREGVNGQRIPAPVGLSQDVDRDLERINVVGNSLDRPYLASPWPVNSADLQGSSWYYDPESSQPRTRSRTPEYSVTYENLDADARPAGENQSPPVSAETLAVDASSRSRIEQAVRSATAGAASESPFDQAIAMQEWLRDPEQFTYSLTLASRRNGENGQPLDPLSNFLETRRGYCTQFSTAMAMMARSQGIPARVAIGFLPGTPTGTSNLQVRAADAHAWPELYFAGLGWTRFEPTPGSRSGDVPAYTLPQADAAPSTTATDRRQEPDLESEQPQSAAPAPSAAPTQAPAPLQESTTLSSPWLWWVVLALVVGGLGALILPLAARWRREQAIREARHPQQQIEAQWTGMEARLRDLGIEGPGDRSPRQMEHHYRRHASLDEGGKEALHRATQTLERSRYAPVERTTSGMDEDVARIVSDIRERASFPTRLSATLFPRTGRDAVRGAISKILTAPARVWRRHQK